MSKDLGRVADATGLSQVEPQEGLAPPGFDPSRERYQIVDGIAFVTPLLEPLASFIQRRGEWAIAGYLRASTFGFGIEILRGGFAVQIGPCMVAVVKVETFLRDSDGSPKGGDGTAPCAARQRGPKGSPNE
jgi:hypothetical protein